MITIVNYGMGNLGSVANMIKKIGSQSKISSDIDEIKNSEKLILPGVGSFDAAVKQIDELGLREIILDFVLNQKKPVLGICLGMQLLMDNSEEGNRCGLGLIKGSVFNFKNKIPSDLKIPHMGWNKVKINNECKLTEGFFEEMRFYFVHSYFVKVENPQVSILKCNYGIEFDAAVRYDNVYGAQFHPEKSQKAGIIFAKNFLGLR